MFELQERHKHLQEYRFRLTADSYSEPGLYREDQLVDQTPCWAAWGYDPTDDDGQEILVKYDNSTTVEIIASNGREVDWDNPTPRWGYITPDPTPEDGWAFQFVDEVHYHTGDSIEDAIARFQAEGKLPAGQTRLIEQTKVTAVYWIHQDHPCTYTVKITPV